jgi:hypothetical protein
MLFMKKQTPCRNLFSSNLKSSVTDFGYSFCCSQTEFPSLWLWGSVALITQHPLSAKVVTNFADKWRSFGPYGRYLKYSHENSMVYVEDVSLELTACNG